MTRPPLRFSYVPIFRAGIPVGFHELSHTVRPILIDLINHVRTPNIRSQRARYVTYFKRVISSRHLRYCDTDFNVLYDL